MQVRIVSGGQTGADRAALDAALVRHLEYAGWCPAGGWAEDLPEPPGLLAAYPLLRATPERDPAVRTARNVAESDATVVLALAGLDHSPGTRLVLRLAQDLGRPHVVCRAGDPDPFAAWLETLRVTDATLSLNVAGPRESEDPGVYAAARSTLEQVLGRLRRP